MASFLDKVKVNTALTDNTANDFSHQHITTTDFLQLGVAFNKELNPGQSIDVDQETFIQLNPLPVPTFGRGSVRNRAFYVPYRTIFRGFSDMIVDQEHVPSFKVDSTSGAGNVGIAANVPTVTNAVLRDVFIRNVVSKDDDHPCDGDGMIYQLTPDPVSGVPDSFDICDNPVGGTMTFYNFTTRGRLAYSLLLQLGYKIIWDSSYVGKPLTALPILALGKVYIDYYWPSQYGNVAQYHHILSWCNYDYSYNPITLTYVDIAELLTVVSYVCYDQDYFTSAWDQPVAPSSGNYSNFTFKDITMSNDSNGYSTAVTNSLYNTGGNDYNKFSTPMVVGTSSTDVVSPTNNWRTFTQYVDDTLHALTDYMKRHQLVGATNALNRYLARFGKVLKADKLNRSLYLGCNMQSLQIGDVVSTSDTEGASLGTLAGKGISYGNGSFKFETDEYGLFMILTSVIPNHGYYQGIDRNLYHVAKTDFWTPEFDALGVQAVSADELYVPEIYNANFATLASQPFGYLPRYAEVKTQQDKLSGNFMLDSINGTNAVASGLVAYNAANSWHLMRVFSAAQFTQASDIVHSINFIQAANDAVQYKRIFYNQDTCAPDNMTVIHNFKITSNAPWKSLFDTYDFCDKGKTINIDANGVRLN